MEPVILTERFATPVPLNQSHLAGLQEALSLENLRSKLDR